MTIFGIVLAIAGVVMFLTVLLIYFSKKSITVRQLWWYSVISMVLLLGGTALAILNTFFFKI